MTGGFEEWATARTPSLLALAAALTEDPDAADAAVSRALSRIRPVWSRVSRDDPDLEARRQVVRACSTARRAAPVLRVLEELSDAEIAEVLGCSESAARRHAERGLVEAQRARSDSVPVEDHLATRAGSAPTQLLTRPPAVATTDEPPRRHRAAWLAALGVVVLVGGVAFVNHESRTPDGVISYPHVDVPTSWRYESYAGVQVQVPDDWGWGASPVRSGYFAGPRHLGSCGTTQASVLSPTDDATYASVLTGFVGRPAILNQRCVSYGSAGSMPYGDALWFDSPLKAGVEATESSTAETRVVGGQHITVFSDDGDLRRQILSTVRQVAVDDNGCPTDPVARPTDGPGDLEPTSLSVCVYSQDTGVASLFWSGSVPERAARAYATAVSDATDDRTAPCPTPTGRWAALGLRGEQGTRWDLVNLGCVRIELADGGGAPLTPRTTESWAYGGASAYVAAPGGAPELRRYFVAPAS